MLTSRLLLIISETFALGATVDAFHAVQISDRRACTKKYTHPVSEDYVEVFSNYLRASHEEKLKAIEAAKERKQSEIEALRKIIAYQKFISKYLVEAHEAKLEAIRTAEAAIVERYEAKLAILEEQEFSETNIDVDSESSIDQLITSSISSTYSPKDAIANKINENLLSASTNEPFTLQLEKENINRFTHTSEEVGRQAMAKADPQKTYNAVDKIIPDVIPDLLAEEKIESTCSSEVEEGEAQNTDPLFAPEYLQPSSSVSGDEDNIVSNICNGVGKQAMVENDSQRVDVNNSTATNIADVIRDELLEREKIENNCSREVEERKAQMPDPLLVSGSQQMPSAVLVADDNVSNSCEQFGRQMMGESSSQKVDANNSVDKNASDIVPDKVSAQENIENTCSSEVEETETKGLEPALTSNTGPSCVEDREGQKLDQVLSSVSTKSASADSEDKVALAAFSLFCFSFLAFLWEIFFK